MCLSNSQYVGTNEKNFSRENNTTKLFFPQSSEIHDNPYLEHMLLYPQKTNIKVKTRYFFYSVCSYIARKHGNLTGFGSRSKVVVINVNIPRVPGSK